MARAAARACVSHTRQSAAAPAVKTPTSTFIAYLSGFTYSEISLVIAFTRYWKIMSDLSPSPIADQIQALTFDVFGTVVDWRSSVEDDLKRKARRKTTSPGVFHLPLAVRDKVKQLTPEDWA